MKKLIALAVAAASVPAMAAVSLSGAVEVSYSNQDAGTANNVAGGSVAAVTESKTIGAEKATLNVAASSELDNGMTVSTSYTLFSAGNALSNDGGEGAITISGAFGSVSAGDVAGPLDARDGQAAATAENDLSAAFGGDMSLVYTLPTLVEGLSISAGMSAKNGGDTGVGNDATGIAFDYTIGGFKVYAGSEESTTAAVSSVAGVWYDASANATTTNEVSASGDFAIRAAVTAANKKENEVVGYGASYTINGLTVAANVAEKEVKDTVTGTVVKYEKQAMGAKYTTGALTLAYNTLEDKGNSTSNSVKTEETDTVSVSYSLGGGASVYAASTSRDVSKADESTVGITFSF